MRSSRHETKKPPQKHALDVAVLEDRVMFSASPMALVTGGAEPLAETGAVTAVSDHLETSNPEHSNSVGHAGQYLVADGSSITPESSTNVDGNCAIPA